MAQTEEVNKQMPVYNSPKNWKEPLQGQENCYCCHCYQCGFAFFGDKRAMICKECNGINEQRSKMADEYPALLEQTKSLKEELSRVKEALEYLMEGVSQLPPLTAIEGVLIPHYQKAKQALSSGKSE